MSHGMIFSDRSRLMRFSIFLLCLLSQAAWAQINIPASQTRSIISSSSPGDNVGSVILAVGGTVSSWSVVSETNPVIAGIGVNDLYFSITASGQIEVLQSLAPFFPVGSPSVTIILSLRVFDDMGDDDVEDVVITVVEDTSTQIVVPVIPAGQIRNVVVTAAAEANVGSPVIASGDPDGWAIVLEDNWVDATPANVGENERFFDIDDAGQIEVLQSLERFFTALAGRGEQLQVTLSLRAFNASGPSAEVLVTIFVVEGTTPALLGQRRSAVTNFPSGAALQGPLLAIGNPTYWTITDGTDLDIGVPFNSAGAFSISATGQLTTSIFLDQFFYTANPTTIELTIVCGNQYGESAPTQVPIDITVVNSGRCGFIPATQTRFVAVTAVGEDDVGFPIDHHGMDSLWIDAVWLDGELEPNHDVATYVTIVANGSRIGQLVVVRDLSLAFDSDVITRVRMRVKGHIFGEQCPTYYSEEVLLYVLPADAGGGTTATDFASFIDDQDLLDCIREHVGILASQPLTADLVLGLTHLDCACRNASAISDLDGLHLFTALTELNLANNLVSDIRPIAGLDALTDLRLAGNMIDDITSSNPLASLVNLVSLDLSYNQIRDSNAFSNLHQLQFLSLAYNDVCDVASIVSLADIGSINDQDTIHLDGNHLLSTGGQAQLAALEATGAFVSALDNDGACPAARDTLQLRDWPSQTVLEITSYIDNNRMFVPCTLP